MTTTPPGTVLLAGIVGSTAYGLAHAGSDIDRIGMFAYPTIKILGLGQPVDSYSHTDPDVTWHEARKMVQLALKANPTITEALWLPPDLYEARSELGDELIGLRLSLLCARTVRAAYLGYGSAQFRRLENRGDGSFSADTRKRTAKHARHLLRLLQQGAGLHRTGVLTVRLAPEQAENCRRFGEDVAGEDVAGEGGVEIARRALAAAETEFDRPGVLPDVPDVAAAEAWLLRVRAAYYRQSRAGEG